MTLTEQEKETIEAIYRDLATQQNFRLRPQQREMVDFAARLFANSEYGIADAPTGTGKTYGYLIPGVVLAHTRGKRLIVSTETVALQDQMAKEDMPMLMPILKQHGIDAGLTVVKGRQRYICPLRLMDATCQGTLLDEAKIDQQVHSRLVQQLDAGWDGERETLPIKVSDMQWSMVCNNRHFCQNDGCPRIAECPHASMKHQLNESRVVITNHAYLLTSIALENPERPSGNPVTDFSENLYVIDEAHHLESRCIHTFATAAAIEETSAEEAGRMIHALATFKNEDFRSEMKRMTGLGNNLRRHFATVIAKSNVHRFKDGTVPDKLSGQVNEYAGSLDTITNMLAFILKKDKDEPTARASTAALVNIAKQIHSQLKEKHEALVRFTNQEEKRRAKWIEKRGEEFIIKVAPFDAAEQARRMLWNNFEACLMTSATIAPGGKFEYPIRSLGLSAKTRTLSLTSPLDYSRSRIIVPKKLDDPNMPGHAMYVAHYLKKYALSEQHKASLVYFTNKARMQQVYDMLSDEHKKSVILQGHLSPTAMIAKHKARIDRNEQSSIWGSNSFSNGIDLPGKYLTLVAIDKLPFPQQNDPILEAFSDELRSRGVDPFGIVNLPHALRIFVQLIGRLVRREDDWGDILCLDHRLSNARYGETILRSTPYNQIHSI